jgi:hypothetical protein
MKLKRIILIFILIISSCKSYNSITYDENINYYEYSQILYGKPLIIFIETDPWLMVIGSDTPSFVLYDSGQVVYKYIEGNRVKHYYVNLSNDEINNFIEFLNISDEIYNIDEYIIAEDVTDQPFNILYLNMDIKKRIGVYGNLKYYAREKTPKVFLDIYDKITTYRNESAKEWFPPRIEIMFSEWPGAKNKRNWIEGYPDLESDTSWHHNDIYSVYLNIENYPLFIEYYNLIKRNKEAVEINGKTMILRYRFPFPWINEPYYNE